MIRILATVFAGLLGLAFGSFLNVCLSRWPQGESVVHPRSHCRNCAHVLTWWENIPLLSWLALRGRCRGCRTPISWRYPLIELAIGILWGWTVWSSGAWAFKPELTALNLYLEALRILGNFVFYWLLVALAVLDAENLWLPNVLTLPGILLGFFFYLAHQSMEKILGGFYPQYPSFAQIIGNRAVSILVAAAIILLIRWLYQLIRHREGMGLGDAKLMALLGAWLGLPGAILAFVIAALVGTAVALILLVSRPLASRRPRDNWATLKLPFGTFLCIGGIVSALWGQPILAAYLRWSGL
jgi:leader peptidase (prepilin peptidase)/N-methyltransferase